jgi:PAS domain S-box-containing protein
LGKLLELEREVASRTEDLKKSEKRYRTLIENTADGVALIQKDKIVFHNKALRKILGYDQRTQNKSKLQDLIYADDRETASRYMKDILSGSGQGPTRYRLKKKDGSVCWTSVNTTLIEYQGQPTLLSSFRDITPSVKRDNMRKDMERMLRHDMRSQLIGILGFINRLINHTSLTEPQLEYCRYIHRCGVQLENKIETYHDISCLEQGFFVLKKDHLNLLDVVKQSRDALRELADRKNINIAIIFNHKMYSIEDNLTFFGDRIYLQNAFNNLLKNAIEASPPDMGVKIKAQEKEKTHIKVSISNWGIVSEEVRSRFFEKYASFGKKDGLGLGTYMARLVVQGHGGNITLQSSKEDGTTVIMELPHTGP